MMMAWVERAKEKGLSVHSKAHDAASVPYYPVARADLYPFMPLDFVLWHMNGIAF